MAPPLDSLLFSFTSPFPHTAPYYLIGMPHKRLIGYKRHRICDAEQADGVCCVSFCGRIELWRS